MQISVVIVTYNSEKVIETCVKSVLKQCPVHIIVVDNASQDQTVARVRQRFPQIEIILLPQNTGYAKGNNLGMQNALNKGADYVLVLNPDTVMEKDCLKELLFQAETHIQSRILGPKIYLDALSTSHWHSKNRILWSIGGKLDKKRFTAGLIGFGKKDEGQFDHKNQVEFVSGTSILIPRKILESGLRFYEPYFMYYEDVEFCLSARKLGYPSYIVPEAKIIHFETSSGIGAKLVHPTGGNFMAKNYYLARNHLLFVERNAPVGVKLHEAIRMPKTIWEHYSKKQTDSIIGLKDYFTRNFGIKNSW